MTSTTRILVAIGLVLLAALAIALVRLAVPSPSRRSTTASDAIDPHLALAVERDAAVPRDAGTPRPARIAPVAPAATTLAPTTDALETTRATFCPEAATRLCRARERCGCSVADPGCVARVQATCGARLAGEFVPPPPSEPPPPEARFEIAPDTREACLAALDALGEHCDMERVVGACAWPVQEAVGVGEPCARGRGLCRGGGCSERGCERLPTRGEAASSLGCAPGLVADEAQVCRVPGGRGAPCARDAQCEAGLRCQDGLCVARAGRMEPCTLDECAFGLSCSGDTPDARRCVTPPAACSDARARCAVGYSCDMRFSCAPSPGSGSGSCLDGTRCPAGTTCEAIGSARCEPALCRTAALASAFR